VTSLWSGIPDLMRAFDKLATQGDAAAREVVARTAALGETEIKNQFSGSHKKGQPHVGGAAPNIVSGTARRSVRADPITKVGLGEYMTQVGPRVAYGRRLELGASGSRGYPYVKPGAQIAKPKFEQIQMDVYRRFLT